ncbi:hypothetical protein D8674_017790 [Pyrus ussuriensis x Pyrus communis]|uniref:Uncharacterized protein n=1 Tax=Pyrus ussuriensis x Pyrus communis TaxID=2448454 RepID=A0A5N5HKR4_9ROSA|nr:hypothetical protein D8674_017790 [Pyrus ussuriensis x Pyrus communis]
MLGQAAISVRWAAYQATSSAPCPDTNLGSGDLRQAECRLGLPYSKREDGKESLFGDESRATAAFAEVGSLL